MMQVEDVELIQCSVVYIHQCVIRELDVVVRDMDRNLAKIHSNKVTYQIVYVLKIYKLEYSFVHLHRYVSSYRQTINEMHQPVALHQPDEIQESNV